MIDGPRVAPAGGWPAQSLVILLHGYGSNGDDLISLAPHWRGLLPGTAFVSPNAPEACPGAPGGYQWWALSGGDRGDRAAGAARAAPVLDAFIDAELARHGLTEAQLALVGFSQGTMMALHVGPRRPRPLAGILGYSGMLANAEPLPPSAAPRPPVLLVHGDSDPMIPVAALHHAKAALTRDGFTVESHISPGLGHSIDFAGLQLGGRFLARVLGRAPAR
jgi:phospholipase/carboxylesterase